MKLGSMKWYMGFPDWFTTRTYLRSQQTKQDGDVSAEILLARAGPDSTSTLSSCATVKGSTAVACSPELVSFDSRLFSLHEFKSSKFLNRLCDDAFAPVNWRVSLGRVSLRRSMKVGMFQTSLDRFLPFEIHHYGD